MNQRKLDKERKERETLWLCCMIWSRLELDCQPDETDLADLAEGGFPVRPMSWPCSLCGERLVFNESDHDCVPF